MKLKWKLLKFDRRFLISTCCAVFGILSFTVSLIIEINYGLIENDMWNDIIDCKRPFPSLEGDKLFSGRKLHCQSADESDKRFRKLSRESEFAFLLIVFIIFCAAGVYLPAFLKRSYRKGSYIIMLEMSFGMLGLAGLAIVLMVCFSSAEFYSDMAVLINDLVGDKRLTGGPNPIHPIRENPLSNVPKGEISLSEDLWFILIVKCVLNSRAGIGASTQLDDYAKREFGPMRIKPISITGAVAENSHRKYSYGDLQTLGFCPHQGLRFVSSLLVLIGILSFWALACSGCLIKQQINPEDDDSESPDNKDILTNNSQFNSTMSTMNYDMDSRMTVDTTTLDMMTIPDMPSSSVVVPASGKKKKQWQRDSKDKDSSESSVVFPSIHKPGFGSGSRPGGKKGKGGKGNTKQKKKGSIESVASVQSQAPQSMDPIGDDESIMAALLAESSVFNDPDDSEFQFPTINLKSFKSKGKQRKVSKDKKTKNRKFSDD